MGKKRKLFIIADDLTGALDTGVHFAGKGAKTIVFPETYPDWDLELISSESEVFVVNTESRHIPSDQAHKKVSDAVNVGLKAGFTHFYKKTDSTLRGKISSELDAFIHSLPYDKLAFIPAYPRLGRFTRNGYHYLGNQLIHETEFANDPLDPVRESYIPRLLKESFSGEVKVIRDLNIQTKLPTGTKTILVFDSGKDEDIKEIAEWLNYEGRTKAIAGSAAIAGEIAEWMGYRVKVITDINFSGPVLVVNGSLNSVSTGQVAFAEQKGIKTYYVDPDYFFQAEKSSENKSRYLYEIKKSFEGNSELIISSVHSRESLVKNLNKRFEGKITLELYRKAADDFAELLVAFLWESQIKTLVVFGGDTLKSILSAMAVNEIRPVCEVLPGLVLSRISLNGRNIDLITKPGGYGEKETLNNLLNMLKNRK